MRRIAVATVIGFLATLTSFSTASAQPTQLDHLKCYKVKDAANFKADVTLEALQSQFGLEQCRVKGKAQFFCVMVDKTVNEIADKTKPPLAQRDLPAQRLDDDRLCYKMKCPKVDIAPLDVTDQFGTRKIGKFKPLMLCTPAAKGDVPPPKTCLETQECNGDCPVATQVCRPVPGATGCDCFDPDPGDCLGSAPQCNGPCPDPADVCRPTAAGDCSCATPVTACQNSGPQCNGDCPAGTKCLQAADGTCDCFDPGGGGTPLACSQAVAPQCGAGTCPSGQECVEELTSGLCNCAPISSGPQECFNVQGPACDGTCPSASEACVEKSPTGTGCECVIASQLCEGLTAGSPGECNGTCDPGKVCVFDGVDLCRCE